MILLAGIAYAPQIGLRMALDNLLPDPPDIGWQNALGIFIPSALQLLVNAPFQAFLLGSLSVLVFEDAIGRPVSIGGCVRAGLRTLGPLTALTFGLQVTFLLSALLVIPGILLAIRWCVAEPALAIEGVGLREALKRSANLTRNHRWTVFALLIASAATQAAFIGAPELLIMVPPGIVFSTVDEIVVAIREIVASAVWAFATLGACVTYVELRRAAEEDLSADVAAVFD